MNDLKEFLGEVAFFTMMGIVFAPIVLGGSALWVMLIYSMVRDRLDDRYCRPWWRLKHHKTAQLWENGRVAVNSDLQFIHGCVYCGHRELLGRSSGQQSC